MVWKALPAKQCDREVAHHQQGFDRLPVPVLGEVCGTAEDAADSAPKGKTSPLRRLQPSGPKSVGRETPTDRSLNPGNLQMAGGMLYRYRRRLMVRSFNALKINAQSSRLVIEFPKAEHEADQYPKSPKTPVSGAASPSRTANPLPLREDSYDKLDSQLDDLMARRKNSYPRRFRTESRVRICPPGESPCLLLRPRAQPSDRMLALRTGIVRTDYPRGHRLARRCWRNRVSLPFTTLPVRTAG